MAEARSDNFSWNDDTISALLETILEYKTKKEFESIDLETVRMKFEDIAKIMAIEKDAILSKDRVASKMKKI